MRLISKLLRRNISRGRIAGFILSNFMGLLILCGAVQFYEDASGIWNSDSSFVRSDYLVVNKQVTSATTLDSRSSEFSVGEIRDIESQPWVRSVGKFRSAPFRVDGMLSQGGRTMSTALFFESIPDRYLDAGGSDWHFDPSSGEIPVIIPKDYLTLYNFGFSSAAGLPRLSEQLMSSVPLTLSLRGEGDSRIVMPARIVGYTNRLNTILVPEEFMEWADRRLGYGEMDRRPTRLIIDVSSPGDIAIGEYLSSHGLEQGGEADRNSAAYMLKVVSWTVGTVGAAITLMSLFILLLSISLLMEKNRDKIHTLLILGVPLREVGRPYERIIGLGTLAAALLAIVGILLLRAGYLPALRGLGSEPGGILPTIIVSLLMCIVVVGFNVVSVRRRVRGSWGC